VLAVQLAVVFEAGVVVIAELVAVVVDVAAVGVVPVWSRVSSD
jgi:hypothetical protein